MTDKLHRGKVIAVGVVAFACWYGFAGIRTQNYGTQWSDVLGVSVVFFFIFAFPVMPVVLRKPAFQQALLGALALTAFSIGGAETFARAQEWVLIAKFGMRPKNDLGIPRWSPFEQLHWLPSSIGWWGCD